MTSKILAFAGLLLATMVPAAARAEWREYETAHFVIYSEEPEKHVTEFAERVESVDGLMRMATGLGDAIDPVKVRIYEVESAGDVDKALGLSDSGVAGFYDSNILGPYAVTPRKTYFQQGLFTPELILNHEYAHHFMLQYFPAIYPPWYVEGFAELIGSSKIMPDDKVAYGMPAKHRGDAILQYWVPVDEILLKPPHKLYDFDLYGQGWALTHFLTFTPERSAQLRQYLARLMAGQPSEKAAEAFGDMAALNRDARRYLDRGSFEYRPVSVRIARPVIQKQRVLGPGEAALIPEVLAFRDDEFSTIRKTGERDRERRLREANLASIREKTARHASDPFALYLLAEADYAAGHYAQSEAAADRLLALQPNHVRGLVRKSIALAHAAAGLEGTARTAKGVEARRLAVSANKADPADPLPLVAFYQSYHLSGAKPPKGAVDGLMQAVQILPRDMQLRQMLVDQLAEDRRWAEAITFLMPLANSPHVSPRRAAAREQMARLREALAKDSGAETAA